MSTVIIIGGGGTPRAELQPGNSYPVVTGEAVANQATSGPAIGITFTNQSMVMTDAWISPGDKFDVQEDGAVALQP